MTDLTELEARYLESIAELLPLTSTEPVSEAVAEDQFFAELLTHRRTLVNRLQDGWEKIAQARETGKSADAIARAEDRWIALLEEYEALEGRLTLLHTGQWARIQLIFPPDYPGTVIGGQWNRLPDGRLVGWFTRDQLALVLQVNEEIKQRRKV